jgi:hypothetical protein
MAALTHTIIANAAMRRSRRPEYFASEAVLQFNHLTADDHFFGPWRRSVRRTVRTVRYFCASTILTSLIEHEHNKIQLALQALSKGRVKLYGLVNIYLNKYGDAIYVKK